MTALGTARNQVMSGAVWPDHRNVERNFCVLLLRDDVAVEVCA